MDFLVNPTRNLVAPRMMMCASTAMDDATIDEVLAGFRRAISAIRPVLAA